MSERLPYEHQLQQQWNSIPLPDEDAAWEDMKMRLEEDDDDRGIIFWWRPGCAWGLLLLLLGIAWWIVRPEPDGSGKKGGNTIHNKSGYSNEPATRKKEQRHINSPTQKRGEEQNEKMIIDQKGRGVPSSVQDQENNSRESRTQPVISRERRNKKPVGSGISSVYNSSMNNGSTAKTYNNRQSAIETKSANLLPGSPGLKPSAPSMEPAYDTNILIQTDKIKATPEQMAQQPAVTDSSNNNRLFLSTGIALQQQLPVAGQKANPYNSQGRKSSLADYIPSVYVRLNKTDKWFLQAEFRYGAPQYTKELLYHQESIADSGTTRFVTNSAARLKKTFYHQLPLTFNYYVLPGWSVGGGVVWNKFYAAISDRETVYHDNVTQTDSVLFKGIVSIKDDTSGVFARSYFQAVIETQYRRKRFSIGARYTFGLQPYIRFTLPGAGTKEEKNSSIQAFLRFELWRSKSGR